MCLYVQGWIIFAAINLPWYATILYLHGMKNLRYWWKTMPYKSKIWHTGIARSLGTISEDQSTFEL